MPTATRRVSRVLIVDDHPVLVHGVTEAISGTEDLEVVGHTGVEAEAVRLAAAHQPDVAIVDMSLERGSGLSAIRLLTDELPDLKVLVFTIHDEMLYAERAMRAGARGYLQKSASADELIAAIRAIVAGRTAISDGLNERLLRKAIDSDAGGSGMESLSDRELEVFEQIGRGLTLHAIASGLGISVKTVETHRENIKKKLDLASAAELARFAVAWIENPG